MHRDAPGRLPTRTRTFGDTTATVRAPKVSDAAAWAVARRAVEDRLRPAFDTGGDWQRTQSELAFVERCLRFRRPMRAGLAVPGIVFVRAAGQQGLVFGETGLDCVDPRTGTGELSAWTQQVPKRGQIFGWALAVLVTHAFTMPTPLRRIVAPQPVTVVGVPPSLLALGFTDETTLSSYRRWGNSWTSHKIWVLHNTFESRQTARTLASEAP